MTSSSWSPIDSELWTKGNCRLGSVCVHRSRIKAQARCEADEGWKGFLAAKGDSADVYEPFQETLDRMAFLIERLVDG